MGVDYGSCRTCCVYDKKNTEVNDTVHRYCDNCGFLTCDDHIEEEDDCCEQCKREEWEQQQEKQANAIEKWMSETKLKDVAAKSLGFNDYEDAVERYFREHPGEKNLVDSFYGEDEQSLDEEDEE